MQPFTDETFGEVVEQLYQTIRAEPEGHSTIRDGIGMVFGLKTLVIRLENAIRDAQRGTLPNQPVSGDHASKILASLASVATFCRLMAEDANFVAMVPPVMVPPVDVVRTPNPVADLNAAFDEMVGKLGENQIAVKIEGDRCKVISACPRPEHEFGRQEAMRELSVFLAAHGFTIDPDKIDIEYIDR